MAKVSVRQPRQVEDEQVQGRAAFEHQAVLEERMTAESFQQVEQVNDLLEPSGRYPVASASRRSLSNEIFTPSPARSARAPSAAPQVSLGNEPSPALAAYQVVRLAWPTRAQGLQVRKLHHQGLLMLLQGKAHLGCRGRIPEQ